jgi:hypothetical protein
VAQEIGGDRLAVDRVGGAGHRRRAERHHIGAAEGIPEAIDISFEHRHVGVHVMSEQDRLGSLQVGVAGHDGIGIFLSHLQEGIDQVEGTADQAKQRVFHPESEIGSHLVVPAAAGVETAGDRADELAQAALDPGVDILIGDRQRKDAGLHLVPDLPEALFDRRGVFLGDDPLATEHPDMRYRAADILRREPDIEPNRGVERFQPPVRRRCEPTAPRLRRPLIPLRHPLPSFPISPTIHVTRHYRPKLPPHAA